MFIFYRWLIHTIWGIYLNFICYARGRNSNPILSPLVGMACQESSLQTRPGRTAGSHRASALQGARHAGRRYIHLFCSATHLHKSSQLLGTLLKCFTIPVTNIDPENWTGRKFASYPLVTWDMAGSYISCILS